MWWLEVRPEHRGRGLGAALLGTALRLLAARGADQVVLSVDDDAPAGDPRDRTAAKRLDARAGFREVDRLWSYRLLR
ncbi:GNAT family N-acetyltransferase [Kribbella flavida]|uniref:GNAT family N-acetyltransferase n=1 Tax=Kribbella flavida TaxID=182640 RepID=UPI0009FD086E